MSRTRSQATSRPQDDDPNSDPQAETGPLQVRAIREADGLEVVLRLAAVWQVARISPLRWTKGNELFQRDQSRLSADPALASPMADVPGGRFTGRPGDWLELAKVLGVVGPLVAADRLDPVPAMRWVAMAPELAERAATLWAEGAFHGVGIDGYTVEIHRNQRAAVLARLADSEDEWLLWDELREAASGAPTSGIDDDLIGWGYSLGVIRVAESVPGGRRAVGLTTLGRQVLGLDSEAGGRPTFDRYLTVQPNCEVIAYRQGMGAGDVAALSCMARLVHLGAAVNLQLEPETTAAAPEEVAGADGGIEWLEAHASKPLPASVSAALRTWADKGQRLVYHRNCTLMEFLTVEDRDSALAGWPAGSGTPEPVGDRLILISADAPIPFALFRLSGSRDYRQPPSACVVVGSGGVSLTVPLSGTDLLIDSELKRIADEVTTSNYGGGEASRRFVVSPESLARAVDSGMTLARLEQWFTDRTGGAMPASLRLMIGPLVDESPRIGAESTLVIRSEPWALDGVQQHPDLSFLVGERLGPKALAVPVRHWPELRSRLGELGLNVDAGPNS